MVTLKLGGSVLNIQETVRFSQYDTSWTWRHNPRKAMVREQRESLRGKVEIDDTYIGGHEAGVRGRETHTKSIVINAVEVKETVITKGKRTGLIYVGRMHHRGHDQTQGVHQEVTLAAVQSFGSIRAMGPSFRWSSPTGCR
jgi:hypothetical protein